MLKKLLVIFAFFMSQSSFAQNTGSFNDSMLGHLMNKQIDFGAAARRIATTPITRTMVIEGAEDMTVLRATKTATFAEKVAIAGAVYSIQEIQYHPDTIEAYIESYPNMIPWLESKVSPYNWGDEYLNNIGVGPDFYSQQIDLENTAAWQQAQLSVTTQIIDVVDSQPQTQSCDDPQVANQVYQTLMQPSDIFNQSAVGMVANTYTLNQSGAKAYKSGVTLFDVNSYNELTRLSAPHDGMQLDHVPAKATLRLFLNQKLASPMTNAQYSNVEKNTTTIVVGDKMHAFGRTFSGKNSQTQQQLDASDLRVAFTKDLTNHYLYVINHHLNIANFTRSAIILYQRDKALCLFN